MSDRLVTIATFLKPVEAELMRNRLAENGIRAMLENYQATQLAWHLTQALGGIKLVVCESDLEAAVAVLQELETELKEARAAHDEAAAKLNEQLILLRDQRQAFQRETVESDSEDDEDRWWEVADEEEADFIEEEAKPWQPPIVEQPVDQPSPTVPTASISDPNSKPEDFNEDELLLNEREELVLKAFRVAVLGCYFFPLHLYATILILNAVYDERPLQPEYKQKLRWTMVLTGIFWLLLGMVIVLPFGHDVVREISAEWTRSLNNR